LASDTVSIKVSQPYKGRKGILIFSLSLLFILSRLIPLFLNFEPFIMEEERYNGTIALEVLNGLKMPLFYYQHQPYAPGAMVVGLLSTPFFLIFGSSYISLKITALILSFGGFILWYIFLDKFFNSRIAIIASLLFIITPPNNLKFSLLSLGNHYEINFFTIASLFLFYNIFFSDNISSKDKAIKQSPITPLCKRGDGGIFENSSVTEVAHNDSKGQSDGVKFFFLGLICGFACYFALTFFATFLTIFIFWFIFDKKLFFKKSFLIFVVGFLTGFSPWIYNTISFKLGSFDFHGKPIYLIESGEAFATKLFRMVVTGIPFSFGFEGIKGTTFDAYLYYLIALVSFIFILKANRKYLKKLFFGIFPLKRFKTFPQEISNEVVLLVFPIFYCLLFTVSEFEVSKKVLSEAYILTFYDKFFYLSFRYFTPLFPFVFATIALFLDSLWGSERQKVLKKGLSIFILLIALSLCGLSYLKLVSPVDFGKVFLYSGSDYFIMGEKFAERYREEPLEGFKLIERLHDQYKIVALRGFGSYFGRDIDILPWFFDKIKNLDEKLKLPLYQGAANGMRHSLTLDEINFNLLQREDSKIVELSGLIEKADEKYKNLFCMELGSLLRRYVKLKTDDEINKSLRLLNHFSNDYQPKFEDLEIEYSGKDINSLVERIDKLPEKYRGDFYKALGKCMAWLLWESAGSFEATVKIIPEKYRSYLYEGAGTFAGSFFINDINRAIKIIQSLDITYRFYLYHALGEALFWKYGSNFNKAVGCIESIDKEGRRYCYEGLGSGIGYMLWWNPERIDGLLNKIEKTYKVFCKEGIRKRIEEDFLLSKQNYYYYFHLKIKY